MTPAGPGHPGFATLNITARCNSRCRYCRYSADQPPYCDDPSTASLLAVIRQLSELRVRDLTLSGGEPTLRSDLTDLVAAASGCGMTVTVITNGTATSPQLVTRLVEAGLRSLVVSCDSLDEIAHREIRGIPFTGVARTIETLRTMWESGTRAPRLVVSTVLSRRTSGELISLAEGLSAALRPGDGWVLQGYQAPTGNSWRNDPLCFCPGDEASLRKALARVWELRCTRGLPLTTSRAGLERMVLHLTRGELGDGYTCRTGFEGMFISASLDVLPCWHLPSVGHLGQATASEIWASAEYDRARERMLRLDCRRCSLACHDPDWAADVVWRVSA